MSIQRSRLHPYSQLLVFTIIIVGIFLTQNITALALAYALVVILLILSKQLVAHIKVFLAGNLPFLILLLLVYGLILKSHQIPKYSTPYMYATVIFLRITILTSLWQYIFNIPGDQLMATLKLLHFRGSPLIIIIGSFVVWEDFNVRSRSIITARLARGHLRNRRFINRIKQLPFILKPLLAATLNIALERSASWKQRNLIQEISHLRANSFTIRHSIFLSILIPFLTAVWLFFIFQNYGQ